MRELAAEGIETPALEREPDLPAGLEPYMQAFRYLSRGRRLGMGCGGIPVADMVAYAQAFDFLDLQRFIRLVGALDEEFLAFAAEKAKSAA